MTISAILLHPGNRLLHGGTADLAMFGTQPVAVSIAQPQVGDAGYVSAFADRAATAEPTSSPAAGVGEAALYMAPLSSDADPAQALATPLSALPNDLDPASPAPAPASEPFSGAPTGSAPLATAQTTSSPPGGVEQQVQGGDVVHGNLIANAFQAPVLDAVEPTLAAGVQELALALSNAPLSAPVALVEAAVTGGITTTLETVAHTVGTIDAIGTIAVSGLNPTMDEVGTTGVETAAAAIASVGDVVDAIGSTSASTLASAHDSVTATVLPLVDHLAGADEPAGAADDLLAGVDPSAGIATLTAMVGASDVFELTQATTGTTTDAVASTLDAVPADTEVAAPLLGEDHGVDDLLHHDDGVVGIAGL